MSLRSWDAFVQRQMSQNMQEHNVRRFQNTRINVSRSSFELLTNIEEVGSNKIKEKIPKHRHITKRPTEGVKRGRFDFNII